MKTKIILLITLILLSILTYSTNNLKITDPQCSWCYYYQASIKSAELEITPKGGFVENNLYLTIGLSDPFKDDNLKLEIILDFGLPANSLVTDSWLWIEGVPKQSIILDRWTASNIYEQIVNRRRDPSLLVKNGANQYSINIYPLKPNETRKFKITYLTPINLSGNKITCEYPSGIFSTSSTTVSKLTVYAHPNGTYINPEVENGSMDFSPFSSADFGDCYRTQIGNTYFGKTKILFTDTNTNPVKFFRYGSGDEGFYQLSFVPSECLNQETSSQKICYLIDYDKSYYKGTKAELKSILAGNLTGSYTEKDSFNVIFSNLALTQAFNEWKPVSPSNLAAAFTGSEISDYSNLIQLLVKGINFVNNSGGKGKIILLSNSAVFEGIEKSNNILSDINNLNVNNIPIDIIDYMDDYYIYNWIGNTYYYGNSYLLSNIARTNSGEYISFYDKIGSNSFSELITTALGDVSSAMINNIDIYTDLANGFCFGRMTFTSGNFSGFKMNKAIHQVGKYKGTLPLSLEITGELNSKIIHNEYQLNASTSSETDSTLSTIWSGFDIRQLETESQNSQVINEIIYQSIESRILSYYTAFLCVEDTVTICENCTDGENPIKTGNNQMGLTGKIKAWPNPFNNHVQIQLKFKDQFQKLEIYNMMGQRVKMFEPEKETAEFNWNGKTDNGTEVKAGIYLVVARYKDKIVTLKIQKI
jgi:Ca-activated chloride channel family protein